MSDKPLQIGLLLCDDVDASDQEQYGTYTEIFQNSFDANGKKIQLTPIQCFKNAPLPAPEDFQGYIISGSRHAVYDPSEWLPALFEFIQSCWEKRIKMVGICFGHQLIVHALGGKTTKVKAGWGFGVHSTTITKPQPWMVDIDQLDDNQYNLIVIHQDQVVELGDKFSVIAENNFCPNSMVIAGDTMLGIQGHPEFSKDFCRFKAEERRDQIGEPVYQDTLQSLQEKHLDSSIILKWIERFLQPTLKNDHS